ncbi:MAG: Peptide chain release factor 3, partial [uncultured Pseudonocardia sp.]
DQPVRRDHPGRPPPHLRRHLPPRRGQVDAHRGARPARVGDRRGGGGARQGRAQGRHVGLDGDGARPRHLHHLRGAAVLLPRPRDQPARHPRPRRLLRGHLPRARRRRRRGDAARRVQGPGGADAQAVRRLPQPRDPRPDLREQVGRARARGPGAARRGGADDRAGAHAGDLAGRHRGRPARGRRVRHGRAARLRAHGGRGDPRAGARPLPRRGGGRRAPLRRCRGGRAGAAARDRRPVRREALPRRHRHPRAVRRGPARHRRRPPAGRPRGPRAVAVRARRRHRHPAGAGRPAVRAGVQGAGGHGPQPPRPHRVPARLLGPLRARHGAHPRGQRPAVRHEVRPGRVRPAALDAGRGVPGRHRRAGQRGRAAPRRHPLRRAAGGVPAHPELRARALRGRPRRRRGQVQAVPQGHRPARLGGRHPGAAQRPARRPGPRARGRRAAAVRGGQRPDGRRVRLPRAAGAAALPGRTRHRRRRRPRARPRERHRGPHPHQRRRAARGVRQQVAAGDDPPQAPGRHHGAPARGHGPGL